MTRAYLRDSRVVDGLTVPTWIWDGFEPSARLRELANRELDKGSLACCCDTARDYETPLVFKIGEGGFGRCVKHAADDSVRPPGDYRDGRLCVFDDNPAVFVLGIRDDEHHPNVTVITGLCPACAQLEVQGVRYGGDGE